MLAESIIYGVIKGITSADEGLLIKSRLTNCDAILDLGEHAGFPYLSSAMFSFPGCSEPQGTYQTQVIHFAASMQAVECHWQQWLEKFEALLQKMYWSSVKLHLETELQGSHLFSWQPENMHVPGQPLLGHCHWEHDLILQSPSTA